MKIRRLSSSSLRRVAGTLIALVAASPFLPAIPSAPAFAQVKRICSKSFISKVGTDDVRTLYCSSQSLDEPNGKIERAIIFVQGAERGAPGVFDLISAIVRRNQMGDRTLILSPHFMTQEDLKDLNLPEDMTYWTEGGWSGGDLSRNALRISSYEVLDGIIERLAATTVFPNLKRIVLAGQSAGGQFTNRYAGGTPIRQVLASREIDWRVIVSNPSSYLYFTPERRKGSSREEFAVPSDEVIAACPGYNKYRYGLEDLNTYMRRADAQAIPPQYAQTEVIYLLAEKDTDPKDPVLDRSCAALLQGAYRLERGIVYHNYLRHHFGTAGIPGHRLVIVPGVGHGGAIFNTPCGARYLLDVPESGCRE